VSLGQVKEKDEAPMANSDRHLTGESGECQAHDETKQAPRSGSQIERQAA